MDGGPVLPLGVCVGVMVYNEAQNLDAVLKRLTTAGNADVKIEQIVVVSSGSTDRSNAIVRTWSRADPRIVLIEEPVRRGKAHAINLLLEAMAQPLEICVLTGGDVLPEVGSVEALVNAFVDPLVGIAGARPVPLGQGRSGVARAVELQWALHHAICEDRPKMGELIAFRRALGPLDTATVVDEAHLEALAAARGWRAEYVSDAVVFNHGPVSWPELLEQRRRIWNGHLRLRLDTGYEVSTMSLRTAGVHAWQLRRASAVPLPVLVSTAAVEVLARVLGTFDVLRGKTPNVWSRISGTKVDIAAIQLGNARPGSEPDGGRR